MKRFVIFAAIAIFIASFVVFGCGKNSQKTEQKTEPVKNMVIGITKAEAKNDGNILKLTFNDDRTYYRDMLFMLTQAIKNNKLNWDKMEMKKGYETLICNKSFIMTICKDYSKDMGMTYLLEIGRPGQKPIFWIIWDSSGEGKELFDLVARKFEDQEISKNQADLQEIYRELQ